MEIDYSDDNPKDDDLDEDIKTLMEDHDLDVDTAERVIDIMDEYGVDEDDAIMLEEEL